MRGRAWAWVLLLPGLLSGCVGVTLVPGAMDRAVRVEDMSLTFAADGSGGLMVHLWVENPTLWDAKVQGVDFELWLDGRRYAVGTRGRSLLLASGAHSTLSAFFPLRSEPTRDEVPPHAWRVEVRGGVALAFGETVRLLPFQVERTLQLPHFRPVEPEPE